MTNAFKDLLRPPRVLHVIPTLGMGGAPRLVLDLVRLLQTEENIDARLCVLGNADSFFPLDKLSVPPVFLNYSGRYRRLVDTRLCIRHLRSIIEEIHPDIVHSNLWLADQISAWALSCRPGIKHVVHIHDTRPWLASARPTSWVRRRVFKYYTRHAAFIASSKDARDYMNRHLGIPIDRMPVIHNGVDLQDFQGSPRNPSPDGGIVMGTAGRFDREKGHEVLIRATAEMKRRGVAVRTRIAGGGRLEQNYLRIAKELGIADRIELFKDVKDMAGFYRDLDLFVMPSLAAEGLPLALLSAMASERPVISTTSTAGASEAIQDGENGLLVSAGDVTALSDAIEQLARDPVRRERMGKKARQRVREAFTVQEMAHRVASIYRQLTAKRASV